LNVTSAPGHQLTPMLCLSGVMGKGHPLLLCLAVS